MKSHMNQAKTNYLNKLIAYFNNQTIDFTGKTICVCLSGGADSVSLLYGLSQIMPKLNISVCACHFNHMIRGEEADRDELFCKRICKELNIKLHVGRDDVPAYARINKLSIEAAARECRYAFFKRLYDRNVFDYCATAHNMNDDAETLLLNLIRGSGNNGASAISERNDYILRPLLNLSRAEIKAYVREQNLTFVTDSTNQDNDYTRNYIRNEIIPKIKKINPSAVQTLSRYISHARVDRDYFDNELKKFLDEDLSRLHKALRTRIVLFKFNNFCGEILNSNIVEDIDNALLSNRRCILPVFEKYEAVVENGRLNFYHKNDNVPVQVDEQVSYGENTVFGDRIIIEISDNEILPCKNFNKISISIKLSFDNISDGLCVRTRKTGDKICIHGMHKSLKKLFIEKKIPKEYRDIIPVFYDDKGIIYVPFVGIADRAFPINSSNIKYVNTVFNSIDKERWNNAYEK